MARGRAEGAAEREGICLLDGHVGCRPERVGCVGRRQANRADCIAYDARCACKRLGGSDHVRGGASVGGGAMSRRDASCATQETGLRGGGLRRRRRRRRGGGGGGGSDGDGSGGGSGVNGDGCPAGGEARAATAGQPGPRAPRLRSVLVVDDEEFIRTLTQLALEGQCEQCVVETAANGALAEPWAVGTLSLAPRLSPRLSRSVHPDPRADAGAGAEQARRVLRSSSSGAGWQTPPLPLARATSPRSTTSF